MDTDFDPDISKRIALVNRSTWFLADGFVNVLTPEPHKPFCLQAVRMRASKPHSTAPTGLLLIAPLVPTPDLFTTIISAPDADSLKAERERLAQFLGAGWELQRAPQFPAISAALHRRQVTTSPASATHAQAS